MTYDPVTYWTARGRTYEASFRADQFRAQESALARVFGELDFASVLEVGCGVGRVGDLVRAVRPDATYRAIDLSPSMAEAARGRGYDVAVSSLLDFTPRRRWDLVLAVEVLMHVLYGELGASVRRLLALASRHVVTVDWTEPLERPAMAHNFRHDYTLLADVKAPGWARPRPVRRVPVGLQTIHVVSR